jgi:DNA primase
VPIVDYYFERAATGNDLTTVQGKKAAAKQLLPIIAKLVDPVEQTHYLQQLGRLINVDESQLRKVLGTGRTQNTEHRTQGAWDSEHRTQKTEHVAADRPYGVAIRLLALLWRHAPTVGSALGGMDLEDVPDPALRELYRISISTYTANRRIDPGDLLANLPPDQSLAAVADAVAFASEELRAEGGTDQVSPSQALGEAQVHCRWLAAYRLQQQLQQLQHDMRTAEGAGDIERLRQLAGTFSQVSQRLASLQS